MGTIDQKYETGRLLGQGGMGEVYEAVHLGTSRKVALKLVKTEYLDTDGEVASRFRREARAVGSIDSPHIVEVLDAGEDKETGKLLGGDTTPPRGGKIPDTPSGELHGHTPQ
jgi:eukaryotic-like serine/threonine-protein kinase